MTFKLKPPTRRAGLGLRGLIFATALLAVAARAAVPDPFEDIIRKTDPLTPAQEQKKFHLPPGFEIQLVAAEPDIGKPMNLAFDEKGRLWLTQSREYPFPAAADKPARDAIKILSRFQANGRAGSVTTFAEGLNIPIGIYPYRDGAVAFSIPYVHYLQDTNGDGRADKRETILGRYSFDKDTHGLTSAFRRGYDGWIYADHGFNNTTTLTAKDGSSITMHSGNCYRFQPDGSHVEQYSWGQVNPFGLMFDPLGDLWSADCHSSPVYLLLRGAYYPSFGKPHDGLGFAPSVISHQHGSTAIAGMVYYAATNFPPEYRGNTFVGNVMTCRINRDSYTEHGSTRPGKEEPDFLRCDDPWFRPVDLQLGPDGAMYVADFYNRIIGHYEVPLDHPGRDRERGRIWRIIYVGTNTSRGFNTAGDKISVPPLHAPSRTAEPQDFDSSRASTAKLIRMLGHSNITVRMLAMNQLVDRVGQPAIGPVAKMMRGAKANAFQKIHGLWVLLRLGGLNPAILAATAQDADRGVRTHAMRVLSETQELTPELHTIAVAGLRDGDAFVRRSAADALGRHAEVQNIRPLLDLLHEIAADDTQLRHVTRMALRNQLIPAGNLSHFQSAGISEADSRALADVAVAVASEEAGSFLLQHIRRYEEPLEPLTRYLRHAARYLPTAQMDELVSFTRQKFSDDFDLQLALFKSVQEGVAQRGGALSKSVRDWGADLAGKVLAEGKEGSGGWYNSPVEGMKETANPWFLQKRASADGNKDAEFLCSSPGGESLTGVVRSQPFTVPAKLEFFLAGHDGPMAKPVQKRNVVRLLAVETKETLAEAFPPRKDVAQPVSWDLKAHAGEQGFLEVADGNEGTAFAWLAVGRFTPEVVKLPGIAPHQVAQRQQAAAELARTLTLTNLAPSLAELLCAPGVDIDTRATLAKTLIALDPNENLAALAPLIGDATVPLELRNQIAHSLVDRQTNDSHAVVLEVLRTAPYRVQVKLAQNLAGSAGSAESLLDIIEHGQAPPQLLLDRTVKDKLAAAKPERVDERIKRLCQNLSPASEQIQKLIDQRRAGYAALKAKAAEGAQVFTKNCAVCHSLDGHGGMVGPQLDGVGGRGLERLVEDVLDPSRNVDRAFRTHIITLKDGDVVSGLPRREEGELLILADSNGKETSIPIKNIEARRESETSLMPDNFGEVIPAEDFNNLMAFLLSKGSKSAAQH
jgi:putative heme-binding domain-containing protein